MDLKKFLCDEVLPAMVRITGENDLTNKKFDL